MNLNLGGQVVILVYILLYSKHETSALLLCSVK